MSMDVGGSKGGIKADINVTPLVDVMLVLLIIVILIAPMLQKGVDVALPEADHTLDKPDTSDQIVVHVDVRQQLYVNGLKQAANKIAWVAANAVGGWMIAHTKVVTDGFATTMFATIGLYIVGSALYWKFFAGLPAGQAPVPEAEPTAGT